MSNLRSVTSRSSRVTFDLPTGGEAIDSNGHNPLSRRRSTNQSSSTTGFNSNFADTSSSSALYSIGSQGQSTSFNRASPSSIGIFGRARSTTPASLGSNTPINSPSSVGVSSFPSMSGGVNAPATAAAAAPMFSESPFSFDGASSMPQTGQSNKLPSTVSQPNSNDIAAAVAATSSSSAPPPHRTAGVMGRFSAAAAYHAMGSFLGLVKAEESQRALALGSKSASKTPVASSAGANMVSSWALSTHNVDLLRGTETGGHPQLLMGDGRLITGDEVNKSHVHNVGRPHLGIVGDEVTSKRGGSQRHGMSQEWLSRTVHVTGAPPGEHEEIVSMLSKTCGLIAHHRTLRFRSVNTTFVDHQLVLPPWESSVVEVVGGPTRSTADIPTPLRVTFSKATSADAAVSLDRAGSSIITLSSGRRIAIVPGADVGETVGANGRSMFLQDEEDHFYSQLTATNTSRRSISRPLDTPQFHSVHGGRRIEVSGPLGLSTASGHRSVPSTAPSAGNGDVDRIISQERSNLAGGKRDRAGMQPVAGIVGVRRVRFPSLACLPLAEYILPLFAE